MNESDYRHKIVIIGSGPAGLTAAIYSARAGLSPLVIAGRQSGGQLMLTTDVDDFPGFEDGIQGPDLMMRMRKQAERFNAKFIDEDVVSVDFSKRPFQIVTESKKVEAAGVILATGASARWLGLPSEQKFIGRGVSACAVCDGLFFRNKEVVVVGGGDTAMREAQHLAKLCKKVTIIHRRDKFRAQDALISLIQAKENVEFLMNSQIDEIVGEDKVTAIKIKNTQTGVTVNKAVDGVFIAIGHKPNTEFLQGQIDLDKSGYILVKNETHTSIEGVFVAGDVSDQRYRQAVTASGAGCKAAMDLDEYLEHQLIPNW